jgi:hypothetical protein
VFVICHRFVDYTIYAIVLHQASRALQTAVVRLEIAKPDRA